MQRLLFVFFLLIIFFTISFTALSSNAKTYTVDPSSRGQITIGGSFLYLEPTATDGDFEYGTVVGPVFSARQITNAQLQAIQPNFRGAFELNYDYLLPNDPYDFSIVYLRYNQQFSRRTQASFNPIIQNFLGGAFVNAQASIEEKINQVDVGFGKIFQFPHHFIFHPHFGFRYVSVNRDLGVRYGDFVLNPLAPSTLTGTETSDFQGGGLFADINFDYLITHAFHLAGYLGSGFVVGHLDSELNANFMLGGTNTPYNAMYHSNARLVPVINEQLGFNYHFLLSGSTVMVFEVGYRGDDFINAIEWVSPDNGFARNPAGSNPPAIRNSSTLGIHGPYAKLDFLFNANKDLLHNNDTIGLNSVSNASGFFVKVTNSAARPVPENADLTYAFLLLPDGSTSPVYTTPCYGWNGELELGYLFESTGADLSVRYSHFDAKGFDSVKPASGQSLFSLNSSGIATVTFAQANSTVNYFLNHAELMGGQNVGVNDSVNIHFSAGIEYVSIKRILNNQYLSGGASDVDKFSVLKSTFVGLGPLFGIDVTTLFPHHFGFVTHFYMSLLFGTMKSTLDQQNFYNFGITTSNTLTTDHMQFMVPTANLKAGFIYQLEFGSHYQANFEIGYQGQYYFKAINLLFPTFLTGLEQKNTSLGVIGPYVTISVMGF